MSEKKDFFATILPPKPEFLKSKAEKASAANKETNDELEVATNSTEATVETTDSSPREDKHKKEFRLKNLLPPKPEFLKRKEESGDGFIEDTSAEAVSHEEKHKKEFSLKSLLPPKPEFVKRWEEADADQDNDAPKKGLFSQLKKAKDARKTSAEELKKDIRRKKMVPLLQSEKNSDFNMMLTIAFSAILALIFICCTWSFLSWIYAKLFSTSSTIESTAVYVMSFTYLQMIVLGILFSQFAHRIFGYMVGFALRTAMQRMHQSSGPFNIHFEWISLRGFFDRTEVILHNVVWKNHPDYNKTPYFLRIGELSVSLQIMDVYRMVRYNHPLKFDRVFVDTVEVYFEKEGGDVNPKSINAIANIGIKGQEAEKNFVVQIVQDIINDIRTKITTFRSKDPVYCEDEGEEEEREAAAEEEEGVQTTTAASGTPAGGEEQKADAVPVKKEVFIELNHMIVFDITAHALDIISAEHMESSDATDIHIPQLIIHRRHVTGSPLRKGGPRVTLTAKKFGGKIGDKVGDALIAYNKVKIVKMLGAATANHFKSNVKSFLFKGSSCTTTESSTITAVEVTTAASVNS